MVIDGGLDKEIGTGVSMVGENTMRFKRPPCFLSCCGQKQQAVHKENFLQKLFFYIDNRRIYFSSP
jgi:hypothetical protein